MVQQKNGTLDDADAKQRGSSTDKKKKACKKKISGNPRLKIRFISVRANKRFKI